MCYSGKKIWSLSTTVRNPERILNFTKELSQLEGRIWDDETQKEFQALLIKARLYIPTDKNLNKKQKDILENINEDMSIEDARDIFKSKNYNSPAMRGRTSFAPIEKAGLATIEYEEKKEKKEKKGKIKITQTGKLLISGKIDLEDCFFKSLIKLQYPNPSSKDFTEEMGYNIRPFLGILSFILKVKESMEKAKMLFNGITKTEFGIFALSICDHVEINKHVNDLIKFRTDLKNLNNTKEKTTYIKKYKEEYLKYFTNSENLNDYVDNTLRNFRLTGYLRVRGNGNYIDIENNRVSQIKKLIREVGLYANIYSKKEYQEYIGDYDNPKLPWENKKDLKKIFDDIKSKIDLLNNKKDAIPLLDEMDNIENIKTKIKNIRKIYAEITNNKEYEMYVNNKDLLIKDIKENEDPIELERLITFGLKVLINQFDVISNCVMGDDGFPTSHAPSKFPDIEMLNKDVFGITEVTMMKNRSQFYAEGQPVLRHHVDFIKKYNKDNACCLFIAPVIHRDTQNAFWLACKYEHEGKKRNVIPITIEQFCFLLENKSKKEFVDFIKNSTNVKKVKSSVEWLEYIKELIYN